MAGGQVVMERNVNEQESSLPDGALDRIYRMHKMMQSILLSCRNSSPSKKSEESYITLMAEMQEKRIGFPPSG